MILLRSILLVSKVWLSTLEVFPGIQIILMLLSSGTNKGDGSWYLWYVQPLQIVDQGKLQSFWQWVNIECYTRDILAGKFEKGVRIWLSSGLCKLALVARRLTVPLTPSQILPMGICKEVPLCCNTKILYMRNQICKIFVIFVLGTWSVTRVVNFLRLGKTA